jgi:ABC-type transport system involved in multi-copper enzyme maturation permease subunit
MNVWPVIERELRVRARQRSTAATRFVAALIAALVCAGVTLMLQKNSVPAEIGQRLFHLLTHILLFLCLLIGAATSSDTLSSEKREGTLGLLFLSNLSRFDILLGKLASASLSGFFGLLAGMPVLAVSLALGGVTQAEFLRTILALINALFFALAAGMTISALSRESANALIGALALVLGCALLPALTRGLLAVIGAPPAIDFSLISPWRTCQLANAAAYQAHPDSYGQSLACVQVLSWVFLLIGARRVGRHDSSATTSARVGKAATTHAPLKATRQAGAQVSSNQSWSNADLTARNNPSVWLYMRRMPAGIAKGCFITLGLLGFLAISLLDNLKIVSLREVAILMGVWIWLIGAALKLWIAALACQLTFEARRSGELEILLTTPMSARKIILAHAVALRRAFKSTMLTLLIGQTCVIAMLATGQKDLGAWFIEFIFTATALSFLWIVIVIDLFAIGWLGLWQGVISKSARTALFKTVLIVMAAPWLWLLFPEVGWVLAILSPFYSMGIMGSAQTKLRHELTQALGREH